MQAFTTTRPATPKQAAACCSPVDDLLDPALFKAFSDPTRLRLLGCLAKCGRPCSLGEVAECCSIDLSVVSRHLALLARGGVLEPTRRGRSVLYRVRYAELAGVLRALADAIDACAPDEVGALESTCCSRPPHERDNRDAPCC